MKTETLALLLQIAAICQLCLAVLSLFLARMLDWKADIARMPLLIREVFIIHCWFISLTLAIFGIITWRFAAEIAGGQHEFMRWFAGAVGFFWGLRSVLQWTHYSREHWRGKAGLTVIHWLLFFGYGAWSAVYLVAAMG